MSSALRDPHSEIQKIVPPAPPTYPAYPSNGGPLPTARPKLGRWYAQPKYNGWRALLHTPTGAMFNHELRRSTIEHEFTAAMAELRKLPIEWLDCEALERRHQIGQGSLIVLDAIMSWPASYEERRVWLEEKLRIAPHPDLIQNHRAYLTPDFVQPDPARTLEVWGMLQSQNENVGCEFYEGLVMKKAGSPYPMQLRKSKDKCHTWMKHRWAF